MLRFESTQIETSIPPNPTTREPICLDSSPDESSRRRPNHHRSQAPPPTLLTGSVVRGFCQSTAATRTDHQRVEYPEGMLDVCSKNEPELESGVDEFQLDPLPNPAPSRPRSLQPQSLMLRPLVQPQVQSRFLLSQPQTRLQPSLPKSPSQPAASIIPSCWFNVPPSQPESDKRLTQPHLTVNAPVFEQACPKNVGHAPSTPPSVGARSRHMSTAQSSPLTPLPSQYQPVYDRRNCTSSDPLSGESQIELVFRSPFQLNSMHSQSQCDNDTSTKITTQDPAGLADQPKATLFGLEQALSRHSSIVGLVSSPMTSPAHSPTLSAPNSLPTTADTTKLSTPVRAGSQGLARSSLKTGSSSYGEKGTSSSLQKRKTVSFAGPGSTLTRRSSQAIPARPPFPLPVKSVTQHSTNDSPFSSASNLWRLPSSSPGNSSMPDKALDTHPHRQHRSSLTPTVKGAQSEGITDFFSHAVAPLVVDRKGKQRAQH